MAVLSFAWVGTGGGGVCVIFPPLFFPPSYFSYPSKFSFQIYLECDCFSLLILLCLGASHWPGSLCYFRDVSAPPGFTLVCSQRDQILSLSRGSRLPRSKSLSHSCGLLGHRSGLQSFSPATLASRRSPERTELGLLPALLLGCAPRSRLGELVRAACAACGSWSAPCRLLD